MVYQPKLGNMVAGNAQFQTIVKSFGLEHLALGALSGVEVTASFDGVGWRSPAGLLQFYRADQRHGNAKSR